MPLAWRLAVVAIWLAMMAACELSSHHGRIERNRMRDALMMAWSKPGLTSPARTELATPKALRAAHTYVGGHG